MRSLTNGVADTAEEESAARAVSALLLVSPRRTDLSLYSSLPRDSGHGAPAIVS